MTENGYIQLDLFDRDKTQMEGLESAIDKIRQRFGQYSLQRTMLFDRKLTGFNPKDEHVIHPVSYFR